MDAGRRFALAALAVASLVLAAPPLLAAPDPRVIELGREALAVEAATRGPAGENAARAWRGLLRRLEAIDAGLLPPEDRIDHRLLEAHLRTRLFEVESLELHRAIPSTYLELEMAGELHLRPCAHSDELIRAVAEELEALPGLLRRAESELDRPAAIWTRQAMRAADYGSSLLREQVPRACVDDSELERRLLAAAEGAAAAVERYRAWLERELLPRSTRRPAWPVAAMERYLAVHEGLVEHDAAALLELGRSQEEELELEISELARRIHPSGEPRAVWMLMQEEAPPWAGIQPMAERYRQLLDGWIGAAGAAVLPPAGDGDAAFDVGALWAPRAPSAGPVLPPDLRTDEEREAWRRSLAPYWTHLFVLRQRLGEELPARRTGGADRPSRRLYRSRAWEEGWPPYVTALLEEEGYFDRLPYLERLKTEMAARQLRIWRVQRTVAKLRLALGEIDLERAVELYVEAAGLPRARARLEVELDSESPVPPLGLLGEQLLRELRDDFRERAGGAYDARDFHRRLLELAGLPLPVVRDVLLAGPPATGGGQGRAR